MSEEFIFRGMIIETSRASMPITCELCPFKDHNPPYYERYHQWAAKFLPADSLRCLFVAESPSFDNKGEYAYIYNTEYLGRRQYLLGGLARGLGLEEGGSLPPNTPQKKEHFLGRFQGSGYFLLDAARCPVNQIKNMSNRNAVIKACSESYLYKEIHELTKVKGVGKIVVIKVNVYDTIGDDLERQFRKLFVRERIPFPSSGQQKVFISKIKVIMD